MEPDKKAAIAFPPLLHCLHFERVAVLRTRLDCCICERDSSGEVTAVGLVVVDRLLKVFPGKKLLVRVGAVHGRKTGRTENRERVMQHLVARDACSLEICNWLHVRVVALLLVFVNLSKAVDVVQRNVLDEVIS